MNTPQARAKRLMDLYRLRASVNEQIAEIEAAMENEREAIMRARAAANSVGIRGKRRPALCGTDSGYYHHLRRRKEPACEACKLAHSAAERSRARARKAIA